MFPRDETSPRNRVGCRTSRVCKGCPTTTRATPLLQTSLPWAPTVKDANA